MTEHQRRIPSIEQIRQRPAVAALEARFGRRAVVEALRAEADRVRTELGRGTSYPDVAAEIGAAAAARLEREALPSLRRVINATGVIIHTNLGRAPLSGPAAQTVAEIASGYTNLEYDLDAGGRGRRDLHAEALICRLTGAEAACVVNNNAAATLLTLAALAAGREAIVSRGELVEIGGGFRVPDVMAQSGALLREVGTTNRTRTADYAAAIGDRTAVILRVHPSNFRIEGFTERPRLAELAALGRRFGVPVVDDLGSGHFGGDIPALREEPSIPAAIAEGADVVMFSGDKLLGGPQAGIIAGRREPLERIRRHPLMRALRVDKMTYAALEATLQAYAQERVADVPVARMIRMSAEEIGSRAERLAGALRAAGIECGIVDGSSTIGGGSAPGSALPTRLIELRGDSLPAMVLEQRLRACDPPVIARIENDRVLLDLRTVLPAEDAVLERLLPAIGRS